MEKLNGNIVALSLGITAIVLYVICLAIVAFIPIPLVVSFVNALQHSIDVSGIVVKNISLAGAVTGVIGWFVIAAATGYIFAFVYNKVAEKFNI
ncbi:hypothetical protein HYW20_05220 [Candidatus Woesearchaeota archaeon]|nr:hypothetical protein [Candidatus Woesearchaeota archaeon]